MSIRQVEKLYKKIVNYSAKGGSFRIDSGVRTEIFQRIMDDVERLMKKMKQGTPGSQEQRELDIEIRKLLLKEIQVIIDDYVVAQGNGTLARWQKMYGDINHYISNFYLYRAAGENDDGRRHVYGFYDGERGL
ncbi:hypothetical protein ACFL43_03345 [Thermodesulfobacteriota bacterium]